MVNEPATLSFETASRLVGRAAYRSGGASMRQAISEARDAEVMLIDFGMAAHVTTVVGRDERGSPSYMAPELRGPPRARRTSWTSRRSLTCSRTCSRTCL